MKREYITNPYDVSTPVYNQETNITANLFKTQSNHNLDCYDYDLIDTLFPDVSLVLRRFEIYNLFV